MTKIQNHYKLQKLLQIHNLQIKQTLFPGTIGVFSWSIQETEWTNIKIKNYIDWFLKQLYSE